MPRTAFIAASLALLACAPVAAVASPPGLHVELYRVSVTGGDADVTVDTGTARESVRIDSGANNDFGVRLLAWAPGVPFTGGIDIGGLSTREKGGPMLDADVSWFAFVGGLRAVEPWFARNGHGLSPYALFGLSMVNADGSARTPSLTAHFDSEAGFGLSPSKPGGVVPYLAAGVMWNPFDHVAVTLDYRVQRFDVDADGFLSPERVSFDLDASGVGIGMVWRPSPTPAQSQSQSQSPEPLPAP